jgi:hypothetical protein
MSTQAAFDQVQNCLLSYNLFTLLAWLPPGNSCDQCYFAFHAC